MAKKANKKSKFEIAKIILAVNGGVVSGVKIPHGVTVEIRDYDVEGYEGNMLSIDVDGDSYKPIIFFG